MGVVRFAARGPCEAKTKIEAQNTKARTRHLPKNTEKREGRKQMQKESNGKTKMKDTKTSTITKQKS